MTISRGVEAGRRGCRRRDRRRPFHADLASVGDDGGDGGGCGVVGRKSPAGVEEALAGLVVDDDAEDPSIDWGGGRRRRKKTTKGK